MHQLNMKKESSMLMFFIAFNIGLLKKYEEK